MWVACYFPASWDLQPWGRTGALAGAIACLGPLAGAGRALRETAVSPCPAVSAWVLGWDVLLVVLSPPSYPGHAITSLPFLKPKRGILSALVGNCVARLWWVRKQIFIGKQVSSQPAMPAGSQLQGLRLSTWLAPGHMSPSALARNPCPSKEDEGRCLLRPAHPPGVALSLTPECWGGIHPLQPSKGTGGGSVSSSCPTAVSHRDFCLLIWTCREATD